MKSANKQKVIQLRHELHQHPELSNNEVWTKAYVIDFLKRNTSLEIVDHGDWFYAVYHGKGQGSIAFRADYDALPIPEPRNLVPHASTIPGVSHKCGHDGHTASLAGLALEVDQRKPRKSVVFLFQPAEEIGAGAIKCVKMFDEQKIDEIYAYHNISGYSRGEVILTRGVHNFASKGLIITFTGSPSHASAPEDGINPAWTIAQIVTQLPRLTDPLLYNGLVMCTIIQVKVGDWAFGTSASEGNLLLTIRAKYEKDMDALEKRIRDLVKLEAKKDGVKVRFGVTDHFPETSSNDGCVDKIEGVARQLGIPVTYKEEGMRGSEDFGHLTKRVPGAMFLLGNGEAHPDLHTTAYDFPDELIQVAADIFYALIEA